MGFGCLDGLFVNEMFWLLILFSPAGVLFQHFKFMLNHCSDFILISMYFSLGYYQPPTNNSRFFFFLLFCSSWLYPTLFPCFVLYCLLFSPSNFHLYPQLVSCTGLGGRGGLLSWASVIGKYDVCVCIYWPVILLLVFSANPAQECSIWFKVATMYWLYLVFTIKLYGCECFVVRLVIDGLAPLLNKR